MSVAARVAVGAFFALLLAVGALLVRDWGVSWDEPVSRLNGGVSLRYLAESLAPVLLLPGVKDFPELATYIDRDYGVAFELPAVLFEKALGLQDSRDIYLLRHVLTFLVFAAGVDAVYRLAARRFGGWLPGLVAATLLVLSPRFFAEGFYNSKDIVFMAAFAIALNTMVAFLLRPGVRAALLHALACAFAIDVRIMGIALPVLTLAFLAVRAGRRECAAREAAIAGSLYFAAAAIGVFAMFPWLWSDPLGHFGQAFSAMARFRWSGEVLYFGRTIPATRIPWHYPLVWIGITTPPVVLAAGCIGVLASLAQLARAHLWSDDGQMQDALFLAVFAVPLAAVIVLHSVLYDGWRQLYFVYPAFVLLAMKGLVLVRERLAASVHTRRVLDFGVAASLAATAGWMVANHPYQQVYFNMLAGHDLRHRFDMDYWGVANRQALEHVLATDASPLVQVRAESDTPLRLGLAMLEPQQRQRLRILEGEPVDPSLPLYRLMNWRLVKFDVERVVQNNAHRLRLAFQAKVGDEEFLSVYQDLQSGVGDPPIIRQP